MDENKSLICEKLCELLKLTRDCAHIEKIEYDAEKDYAFIYDGKHSPFPLNICGDSGMQMIADIIKGFWG